MAIEQVATGILVMLMDHDQSGSTPAKTAMRYKRGDIVAVYPPGKRFWNPPFPPWLFVEVTGVPLDYETIRRRYEQMEQELFVDPQGETRTRPLSRRVFQVNLGALPQAMQDTLATDRYVSVPWTALRSYVRNKLTNETEG